MPALSKDDVIYRTTDISSIRGVGPSFAGKFSANGIHSLFDLLLFLPFRYLDRTFVTPLSKLPADGSFCLVQATITAQRTFGTRTRVLRVSLEDENGRGAAVFFNAFPSLQRKLVPGTKVILFGQAKYDNNGFACLQHPEVKFGQIEELEDKLTPVYHSFGKTPQATIRKVLKKVLGDLRSIPLTELLPSQLNPYNLTLTDAIEQVHYPSPPPDHKPLLYVYKTKAFERICYEELTAYEISLLSLKRINLSRVSPVIKFDPGLYEDFTRALKFSLTGAQQRAFADICRDLQRSTPMLRLLHGDVGSGKTLVAVLSCLQVQHRGYQSVVLAPTELLAQQHYKSFKKLLEPFGVVVVPLYSSLPKGEKQEILAKIKDGTAQVIIGTHSVFQSTVSYKSLALAIIDEQHRFGIEQRVALLRKAPGNTTLHQLVMTATPIPRTQQLALFADLDVSTIDEMPQGREPTITSVICDTRRREIISHLEKACHKGIQAYWVCPRIEEDEDDNSSVRSVYEELSSALPTLRVGLLHGQLSAREKEEVMTNFINHTLDILVATTIIEVGVDVPNANIIIIESAQKLGLAQLHQLRGRVGRGSSHSYCLLIYKNDMNDNNNDYAMQRLEVMRNTTDGFKIAEADLQLRGPGEVFGTRQTGFNTFRIADITRDRDLIESARLAAQTILEKDPELASRLVNRWFPNFATG